MILLERPTSVPPRWAAPTSLALVALGLVVSAFLSYESLTAAKVLACPVGSTIDCSKVTSSPWSKLMGVPVSYLGLLFFVGMAVLCTKAAWERGAPWVQQLRLVGASVGVGMVLYLVWAELFRIGAICLWCTVVHVLSFAVFVVVVFAHMLRDPVPPSAPARGAARPGQGRAAAGRR